MNALNALWIIAILVLMYGCAPMPRDEIAEADEEVVAEPLQNAAARVTKKYFGIKVSPDNSPTIPEHFTGYHTGADLETFDDELDAEVSVAAICDGPVLVKRSAQGYGGVLVQSCTLDDQRVTVIYGHIQLATIRQNVGDMLARGEQFALLGEAWSTDTGNERKHLHLGIHKGETVNILGYVQLASELSNWIDPETYVK